MAKYTIDNSTRIFLIKLEDSGKRDFFVNIHDIQNVLKNEIKSNEKYTIKHYWNKKFEKISKKELNIMFENSCIDFKI